MLVGLNEKNALFCDKISLRNRNLFHHFHRMKKFLMKISEWKIIIILLCGCGASEIVAENLKFMKFKIASFNFSVELHFYLLKNTEKLLTARKNF